MTIISKLTIIDGCSKKRALAYLMLIPLLIFMLIFKINFTLTLSIIIILGLSIGLIDINKYLSKIDTWEKTLGISLILLGCQASFALLGLIFIPDNNPQGVNNLTLTTNQLFHLLKTLPFIAVGEEFFKFFIFIAILFFINGSTLKRAVYATLISSLVFGFIHIINYKLVVGSLLTLWAIPSYFFLLYFRSIYPLIISHFLWDGFSFSVHLNHNGWIIWVVFFVIYGSFIYKYRDKERFKHLFTITP